MAAGVVGLVCFRREAQSEHVQVRVLYMINAVVTAAVVVATAVYGWF